jgi:hypothetical protein
MMKKQFLLMTMALLPMMASADDSGNCGYRLYDDPNNPYAMSDNVRWSYVESTHTLTISGTGEMMNFGPWVDDDPTSFVPSPWNNYKESIQKLVVQSGVTSVDGFKDCKNLTSVTLPNTIESIEPYAFSGCGFSSITIPNSVNRIGFGAFRCCDKLTSVTIPSSVTSIGIYAFEYCSSLGSIQVEPGNTVYDSRNNCNAIIHRNIYEGGSEESILLAGCKNTVIPDGVTFIEYLAFAGCTGITSLIIPQSVKQIRCTALSGCSNLSAVYCYAADVPNITSGYGAFSNSTLGSVENATLYVPSTLVEKYKNGQDLWGNPSRWGSEFKAIMPIENAGGQKCATPTIKIKNGALKFECATEGVEFHYSYTVSSCSSSGTYDKASDIGGNGVLLPTATISVYASKSGYSLSDTATLTANLSNGVFGDLTGDGVVDVADHVELTKIILKQDE